MVFATSITGTDGKVTIPSIGALIGYFAGWQLAASPDKKTYILTATFGYNNPTLWAKTEDGTFTRRIVIQVGKDTFYRLEQEDGASTTLSDTHLVMQGVTLTKGD